MTPTQAAIKRATDLAQQETTALDGRAMDELERLYQSAAEDVRNIIIQGAGQNGDVSQAELNALLAKIDARLKELSDRRDAMLKSFIDEAASLAAWAGTAVAISAMTYLFIGRVPRKPDGKADMAFEVTGMAIEYGLDPKEGETVSDKAAEYVWDFLGPDKLRLSDRIWRLDRMASDVLADAIRNAIVQGGSASATALDFLKRGEPIPADIAARMGMQNGVRIGSQALDLLTGEGGTPLYNAMRVFRTEINRAHIEAYRKGIQQVPGAVGTRFMLSPLHPQHDICDLHATANLYGLGRGVYPFGKSPLPAHPNTLSYEVVVFDDEVTDADREEKETQQAALARLTPAQRIGALGVGRAAAFAAAHL